MSVYVNSKNSRSRKLRRYQKVYNAFIQKNDPTTPIKSPRHKRNNSSIHNNNNLTPKKKNLNSYQKFVKTESKKEKYKDIPGKQRLREIAYEWEKLKKNSYI